MASDAPIRTLADAPQTVGMALESIENALMSGHFLVVAWSGGKDSTALLILALNAWKRVQALGYDPQPIAVLHGDTGVENPSVRAYAHDALDALDSWAGRHGVDVRIEVYRPELGQRWAVEIIGRGALPTWVNSKTRKCSYDWKVRPSKQALKRLRKDRLAELRALDEAAGDTAERERRIQELKENGPVLLLGSRRDESATRARSMERHHQEADAITEQRDVNGKLVALTLSPLAEWTEWDVFEFLGETTPEAAAPYTSWMPLDEMLSIYRDANGGSCSLIPGARTAAKACGARTGCWACVAVSRDESLEAMLERPEHAYMRGLNDLRNWLSAARTRTDLRSRVPRSFELASGVVDLDDQGFAPRTLDLLLRASLTLDKREAERARRFRETAEEDRWQIDPYLAACRQEKRAPDPVYIERMKSPRFEIVGLEELFAIAWRWSLYGQGLRPFAAIDAWWDVYVLGQETDIGDYAEGSDIPLPRERVTFEPPPLAEGGLASLDYLLAREGELPKAKNSFLPLHRQAARFSIDVETAQEFLFDVYPFWIRDVRERGAEVSTGFSDELIVYLESGIVRPGRNIAKLDEIARRRDFLVELRRIYDHPAPRATENQPARVAA